jgi:hypothetical protein
MQQPVAVELRPVAVNLRRRPPSSNRTRQQPSSASCTDCSVYKAMLPPCCHPVATLVFVPKCSGPRLDTQTMANTSRRKLMAPSIHTNCCSIQQPFHFTSHTHPCSVQVLEPCQALPELWQVCSLQRNACMRLVCVSRQLSCNTLRPAADGQRVVWGLQGMVVIASVDTMRPLCYNAHILCLTGCATCKERAGKVKGKETRKHRRWAADSQQHTPAQSGLGGLTSAGCRHTRSCSAPSSSAA